MFLLKPVQVCFLRYLVVQVKRITMVASNGESKEHVCLDEVGDLLFPSIVIRMLFS